MYNLKSIVKCEKTILYSFLCNLCQFIIYNYQSKYIGNKNYMSKTFRINILILILYYNYNVILYKVL